jgi:hypothetical protein
VLAVAQDLAGDGLRLREQLVGRNDARDEVVVLGPPRVDRLRGEHHFEGQPSTDDVHQTSDPTVHVMEAPTGLERAKAGRLGCDPDVARQCKLETGRERPSVDRGDDRLADAVQPAGDPTDAGGDVLSHPPCGSVHPGRDERLEVRPGAEGVAHPGDNGDVHIRIIPKGLERAPQQLVGLVVDGILRLRSVEADVRDPIARLVDDLRHECS